MATGVAGISSGFKIWQAHAVALFTAIVWSTTFISTKKLLIAGLTPEWIFICRFAIAYLGMLFISGKPGRVKSVKDELMMVLAGISGGSLYFYTENTALQYTYTTNVSILVTTAPLFSMLLLSLFYHQKIKGAMTGGALISLAGVVLVVLNGRTDINISPAGDMLSIVAALMWGLYGVTLKYLGARGYSSVVISRKVFFWGIVTMGMFMPFFSHLPEASLFTRPVVAGNLLFLGVFASLICYVLWNKVVEVIGPAKATNYVYLNPIGTMITAALVLSEPISWSAIVGATIIIAGVIIVEKSKS